MSLITGSIKDIISIKIKLRHDSYSDQFCRIFMAKMCIISSLIMSVDFFSDKVHCIIPPETKLSTDFIHSACWIQGFYIYEEMRYRMAESGYYGLPKDIELDGIDSEGDLCRRVNRATHHPNLDCQPLTKTFYLQYQYFPFFIASLAIMYYMPYMIFRMINTDVISLNSNVKKAKTDEINAQQICETYFNRNLNGGIRKLRGTLVLNICVKIIYLCVTILSFEIIDRLLSRNYKSYGNEWLKWSYYNNTAMYEYADSRLTPQPGNKLLPPMGFCDITEGTQDRLYSFVNSNRFICEISPNVFYQYILVVLWFFFVLSITIATMGLIAKLGLYVWFFGRCILGKELFPRFTIRELEYLYFIRRKNLALYGDVVRLLRKTSTINGGVSSTQMDQHMKPCRNSLLTHSNEGIHFP